MRDDLGRFVKGSHWRPQKPHWSADWLREQYAVLGRSTGEIALEAGCTDGAILYWLRKHGISRRSVSDARLIKHWGAVGAANPMHGKTGALNPRFVDGSSPERQRMYARGEGRAFIRAALERDRYRCRRCDEPKRGRRSLHVHHVKAWAGNEALRFDLSNVVILCRPCHSWVHSRANVEREFLA